MAVGAILGAALTDHSAHPKGLFVGGLDVIDQPGTSGNGYGVPIESVEVIEAGPGGVSSMHFTIDDPLIVVTVAEGMDIRFWDFTNDVPIFSGWVQSWSYRPSFGNQGRGIDVVAIGADALLDWAVTTQALTFAAFPDCQDAIQSVVANCAGVGPLRAFYSPNNLSSQDFPTGRTIGGNSLIQTLTIPAGSTLRESIRLVYESSAFLTVPILTWAATVDFYWGLRTWTINDPGRAPLDWTTMTVVDTSVGALVSEGLNQEVNASEVIHQVMVIGGNAAGSGLVSDGSGIVSRVAVLSDSTLLTAATRDQAALMYLRAFALAARGSFSLVDHTPVLTRHAGGVLVITDTRASLPAAQYAIGDIRKTFQPVRQTWEISYGGNVPSAVSAIRRLTRTALS